MYNEARAKTQQHVAYMTTCMARNHACAWASQVHGLSSSFKAVRGITPDYLSALCRPNAEDTACSRLTRQHTAISRFHVPRPTLVIVHFSHWASFMEQTTSNNLVMWFTAEFQNSTKKLTFSDGPVFHSPFILNAGALELDSMLRRLRTWHFIIKATPTIVSEAFIFYLWTFFFCHAPI